MQLSSLLLKSYFVTNISVKAGNPNFSSIEEAQQTIASARTNLTSSLETARDETNPRIWKVALQFACRPSGESGFLPYVVEAELVGFFEVHESIAESKIEDLVTCNAPAILFGAARELVLLITGRGPFPPFTLPSVTFIDNCPSKQKKADGTKTLEHAGKSG